MDKYYELMSYDDLDYYYVFADARTYELLFLNNAICSFLNVKLQDCIGRKCYEIIYNRDDICPYCVNEELITSKFNSMEIIQPLKNIQLNCNISMISIDNRLVRVSKLPINSRKTNQIPNISGNDILKDLLQNIRNENFGIQLQPKFEIIKKADSINDFEKKLVGAEVLVRRLDPNLKETILPTEFIDFYENMSIIRHLDLYVFEKACQISSKISSMQSSLLLSVNFSCATLLEFDFISNIQSMCDNYNVEYNNMMIEISRDKFLENHKNFIKIALKKLASLGFKLSLANIDVTNPDLNNISIADFNEIKINRDFVIDYDTSNNQYHKNIIDGITQSYKMDCNVFAVGIESKEKMKLFYELNCNYQQGFYHEVPLDIDEFFNKYIT